MQHLAGMIPWTEGARRCEAGTTEVTINMHDFRIYQLITTFLIVYL